MSTRKGLAACRSGGVNHEDRAKKGLPPDVRDAKEKKERLLSLRGETVEKKDGRAV